MTSQKYSRITGDDEVSRIIRNELTDQFCREYVLFGEEETCLPEEYLKQAEAIRNFKVRDSDVMIIGYPKSGTTWSQEMVWLIVNDLDYKSADTSILLRSPLLELGAIYDWENLGKTLDHEPLEWQRDVTMYLSKQEGTRCMKTHLTYCLLPEEIRNGSKSPKIIYITRNPMDACVSFSHHGRIFQGWKANIENFAKAYLAGRVLYGSYWKHILGYWQHRNSPNVLFIRYEDMKADLPAIIKKIAQFLGKEYTEDQIQELAKHLSFDNIKNNKAVNAEPYRELRKKHNLVNEEGTFMRSGTVGKYKEEMSPELIEKFNKWIKDSTKGTDCDIYNDI